MEDPVIHRNYFFLLWIFVTFATDSQGTWTLPYIFFTVINFVMKKESKNLMFFLFFLVTKSFQPRIDWQLSLCQLYDQ